VRHFYFRSSVGLSEFGLHTINTNAIQNEFITRRLVQAKNRNQRRLLPGPGVISIRDGEKFTFKVTFKN